MMKTTKLITLMVLTSMLLLSTPTAVAQQDSELLKYSCPTLVEPGEAANPAAFLDQFFTKQMQDYPLAGIAATVVKDGEIIFLKGYGYADLKNQSPVDPAETIFRVGSVSKLFTWTAVMQLAEQGKIDLNADVNTYLPDFQIPATYPQPITMLNLLGHNAGFEERAMGTESPTAAEMISLHDYLKGYMPDRVRAPGLLSTYSNYGTALAGYIVEVISGMPFEQYIETYIFTPLSMSHSTFRQPLPSNLAGHLAKSYSYDGSFLEGKFDYVNLAPAGSMSSTAYDMANFILAHLQDGQFGDSQILSPDSIQRMHSHLFSDDERLDGFAYGFMEWNYNGQRVLWHSGDIGYWHSSLAIIPDQQLGFFVSYNSNESLPAISEFYYAFMDAFFPGESAQAPQPLESSATALQDLAGEYRSTRTIYNHIDRVASFPGNGHAIVNANQDGTLSIDGVPMVEIEPLVFSTMDGIDKVIFHQDEAGLPTHMQVNSNQAYAYERLSWYETKFFNTYIFIICYAVLLSAVIAALVGFLRRHNEKMPGSLRIARLWAAVLSAIFLLAPLVLLIYTYIYIKSPFPLFMVAFLVIILAASILVIGPILFTALAWLRRYGSLGSRIHYTLITIALLGMVWLMYYWQVLGFRY